MSENKKHIEALKLACVGYPLKESTLSVAISALKMQGRYEALRDAANRIRHDKDDRIARLALIAALDGLATLEGE